jgi:hypothetical protein
MKVCEKAIWAKHVVVALKLRICPFFIFFLRSINFPVEDFGKHCQRWTHYQSSANLILWVDYPDFGKLLERLKTSFQPIKCWMKSRILFRVNRFQGSRRLLSWGWGRVSPGSRSWAISGRRRWPCGQGRGPPSQARINFPHPNQRQNVYHARL